VGRVSAAAALAGVATGIAREHVGAVDGAGLPGDERDLV
jgi:hypothetical protein